jgi:carboxyl-terminal processing protease
MVKASGDRWSYYIPASEYEACREQSENTYVGVGMTTQATEDGSGSLIVELVPGGPAEEAGLQIKDLLIRVGDTDVRNLTASEVRTLVKGEENTYVSLTILRQGTNETISVERRKVKTPVATFEMLEDQIGLVTIENFDERCAEESIAAIETLLENGAEKLIFDVRYNPGGFADELVKLLDYLLPEGDLFRTVRYDGKEHVDTSDADCLEMPMAVLVNSASYSAAEFFAAALREYEAAVVVGEQTVGKGYFQITYQLSDGSAVALSSGKYFTPKGISLAETGVTPDVVVIPEEKEAEGIYYGTLQPREDPQIQAAIRALK